MPRIFPDVASADHQGLLAVSRTLTAELAFAAHCEGVFPWFENDDTILWWAPDPRCVIPTARAHLSRSLRKTLRDPDYRITLDMDFAATIDHCARLHGKTWITPLIRKTYTRLHQHGLAHSCELWRGQELIGGMYGVGLDKIFCGESMFSVQKSASKIVLLWLCAYLAERGVLLLDTQFMTPHLMSMGAVEIPRQRYQTYLSDQPQRLRGNWAQPPEHPAEKIKRWF